MSESETLVSLASAVAAAREGDEAAFAEIVRSSQDRIYSLALRILSDRERAWDAVQEVYLRAWRSIGRFRGDSSVETWLYRIAINVCRDHLSKKRRWIARILPLEKAPDEEGPPREFRSHAPGPEEILLDREMRAVVVAGLERLGPEDREIIVLREMEELPYDELAKVLGITIQAVKSRLHRARKRLHDIVETYLEA